MVVQRLCIDAQLELGLEPSPQSHSLTQKLMVAFKVHNAKRMHIVVSVKSFQIKLYSFTTMAVQFHAA